MGRIDEKGLPIHVDDAVRARLRDALDRDGVVAALLFGSQAAGRAGPLSDVDVAVWLDPSLSDSERFRLRLELIGHAAGALRTNEVDLVVLNDASPLLRHRALRSGVRLLDRDPVARVRLESRAVSDYLDTKPSTSGSTSPESERSARRTTTAVCLQALPRRASSIRSWPRGSETRRG
jgi:predicted nucleotidyltransferase